MVKTRGSCENGVGRRLCGWTRTLIRTSGHFVTTCASCKQRHLMKRTDSSSMHLSKRHAIDLARLYPGSSPVFRQCSLLPLYLSLRSPGKRPTYRPPFWVPQPRLASEPPPAGRATRSTLHVFPSRFSLSTPCTLFQTSGESCYNSCSGYLNTVTEGERDLENDDEGLVWPVGMKIGIGTSMVSLARGLRYLGSYWTTPSDPTVALTPFLLTSNFGHRM